MTRTTWLMGAAAAAGLMAASLQPAAADDAHRGGTLRLLSQSAGGSLDPKINYTLQYWTVYQYVYDGLVTFKHAAGSEGFTIVPDLAEAMPEPQNGGKTYVFKIRKGIKFANGQDLTVKDVVASFQRIFKVSTPTAGSFYNGIVGADVCLKTPGDLHPGRRRGGRRGSQHRHHQSGGAGRRVLRQARRAPWRDPAGRYAAQGHGQRADHGHRRLYVRRL